MEEVAPIQYRQTRLTVWAGWLSLIYGLYSLARLPRTIMLGLARPPVSVSGPLAGLMTLWLPWKSYLFVAWANSAVYSIGLAIAGYALLRTRRRILGAGLLLLIPSFVGDVLFLAVPVMMIAGQVRIDPNQFLQGSRPMPPQGMELYHSIFPWIMGAVFASGVLSILYFLWLWREWKRMKTA